MSATRWFMGAFAWREDQSDAELVPDGVSNAGGTGHDIPSQEQCERCHRGLPDTLLSVSAIQLSHDGDGVTLDDLIADGSLSSAPGAPFTLPGDPTTQAALGYLHANCGPCHNPNSEVFVTIDMQLWLETASLGSVEATTTFRTTVAMPVATVTGSAEVRVDPGRPETSALISRMSERGTEAQMPPLATELVDEPGIAAVHDFILSLPAADGGVP
jgi:hypothetical protein